MPSEAVHKYFPRSSSLVFRITKVPLSIFIKRGSAMETGSNVPPADCLLQSIRAGGIPDVMHVK